MMTTKELREAIIARYALSSSTKTRTAINVAIRASVVGGDDVLDALELTDRLARRLGERKLAGHALAQQAHTALQELRDVMAQVVFEKYEGEQQ
jgi:hypothetical protein